MLNKTRSIRLSGAALTVLLASAVATPAFGQPADVRIWQESGCGPFPGGDYGALVVNLNRYRFAVQARSSVLQDGASLGFRVYSPNGSATNIIVDRFELGAPWASSAGYWPPLGGSLTLHDIDSVLPESWSISGATSTGGFQEDSFVDLMWFEIKMPQQSQSVICIDSVSIPPAADWLMTPGGAPTFLAGNGDGIGSSTALCFETYVSPCGVVELTNCPDTVSGSYCGPITYDIDAEHIFGYTVSYLEPEHTGSGVASVDATGTVTYIPAIEDTASVVQIYTEVTSPQCCNITTCTTNVVVTYDAPLATCQPNLAISCTHVGFIDTPAPQVLDDDSCENYVWSLHSVNPVPLGSVTIDPTTGIVTWESTGDLSFLDFDVCLQVSDGISEDFCCFMITCLACRSCPCCFDAGDADYDGSVNIADATFLIQYIFSGGPTPLCCESADSNGDGSVNIADVTTLIAFIFSGGADPVCGPLYMSCNSQ